MHPLHLSLTLLLAQGSAPPPVPPCIGDIVALNQRAAYSEMLSAADECARTTKHPRTEYYAGLAYMGLRENAQAVLRLRRYLADSAAEPARLREVAEVRLTQAMQAAGSVSIVLSPPVAANTVRIEVRPEQSPPFSVSMDRLEVDAEGARLWLDPGTQQIYVYGADRTVSRTLQIVAGQSTPLQLSLAPEPKPVSTAPVQVRPQFPRRPWLAATSGIGGVGVVAGTALAIIGQSKYVDIYSSTTGSCGTVVQLDGCRGHVARSANIRSLGLTSLGAGLGVLTGGLTALIPNQTTRTRAWWGELGGGVALTVTGTILMGVFGARFNRLNTDSSASAHVWSDAEYYTPILSHARGYSLGGGLLGLGVGLAVSSAAGILVLRRGGAGPARSRIQPHGIEIWF